MSQSNREIAATMDTPSGPVPVTITSTNTAGRKIRPGERIHIKQMILSENGSPIVDEILEVRF